MLRVLVVVTLLINLIACSGTPEWKGVYKEEGVKKDTSKLEIPPDLSAPRIGDNLVLPNIATRGSTYSAFTNSDYTGAQVLPAKPDDIKVIRDGINQWLEVKAPVSKLWSELRVFFTEVGFEIKRAEKVLGVMETNWLENRASLPTNWFTKLLNRISSTGIRDKYRARLEKTDDPEITRVFITHQGLKEYGTDEIGGVKIWWQTRPSDPELEAEMYQRYLIFRDVGKDEAKNLAARIEGSERTKLIDKDDTKVLQVGEEFSRTWRRVGIALDRIGLLVEDRNRSGGLFYLRITDDFKDKIKEDKGFFAGLFSNDDVKIKDRYLLNVDDQGENTIISIYEVQGTKADPRFVEQLLKDLKSYLD